MEHFKILSSLKRKWILLLCVMFARIKSEDEPMVPGVGGLFCISDCETCPVICSPPPPPTMTIPKPGPSSPAPLPPLSPPSPAHHHHYSPPQSYYFPASPPPESLPITNTPHSPVITSAPPPPSYISWGGGQGPPLPFPQTPPTPSLGYMPSIQTPPGMGQKNYSYPYYYFYASKASSIFDLKGSSFVIMLLLSIIIL